MFAVHSNKQYNSEQYNSEQRAVQQQAMQPRADQDQAAPAALTAQSGQQCWQRRRSLTVHQMVGFVGWHFHWVAVLWPQSS